MLIGTNNSYSSKTEEFFHFLTNIVIDIKSNSQFGKYKCEADNTHGTDEQVIRVIQKSNLFYFVK